jgi:P27 family predicted phage terminase small subunit
VLNGNDMAGNYGAIANERTKEFFMKPTNIKVLEGNKGKRPLNKQEPDPEYLEDLTAPDYLSDEAKKIWDDVAPNLRKAMLLTIVDVQMLAMGCTAIAQYRIASRMASDNLVKAKMVEPEKGGEAVPTGEHVNPWLIVQSMCFKQAMAMFMQFGMSPAARARISINPQGDLFGNAQGKEAKYFA